MRRISFLALIFHSALIGIFTPAPAPAQSPENSARLVMDIRPGLEGGIMANGYYQHTGPIVASGQHVFFKADDGIHGEQLWRSDGTTQGTIMLTRPPADGKGNPYGMAVDSNGRIYFSHEDPTHGRELWISDGTSSGTKMMQDLNPGTGQGAGNAMIAMGNKVFFDGADGQGTGLWSSDGAPSGTHLVKSHAGGIRDFIEVHGADIYYTSGFELWRSDGTSSGTIRLFNSDRGAGKIYPQLTFYNNHLYFREDTWDYALLWMSDGAADDAIRINTPFYLPDYNFIPLVFRNSLYFLVSCGVGRHQVLLYKSDGTETGTLKTLTDDTRFGNSDQIFFFHQAGDMMLIRTDIGLWRSDGTDAGTLFLASLPFEGANGSNLMEDAFRGRFIQVPSQERCYISAQELWQTDGTPGGTKRLTDINPGSASSHPQQLTLCQSKLFFYAVDALHGRELWCLPIDKGYNATHYWAQYQ